MMTPSVTADGVLMGGRRVGTLIGSGTSTRTFLKPRLTPTPESELMERKGLRIDSSHSPRPPPRLSVAAHSTAQRLHRKAILYVSK
jgi:hypothetical protein